MEKLTNLPFIKNIMEKGKWNIIVVIGFIGILFIATSEMISEKPSKEQSVQGASVDTVEVFRQDMQNDLTALLSQVNGVGKVQVMITLEGSAEYVYAQQERSSEDAQTVSGNATVQETSKNTYENQFVMIEGSGAKNALIEKTLQPAVQGVVVVCEGADDIKVISDVTNAVAVALNVTSNRICVIQMQ